MVVRPALAALAGMLMLLVAVGCGGGPLEDGATGAAQNAPTVTLEPVETPQQEIERDIDEAEPPPKVPEGPARLPGNLAALVERDGRVYDDPDGRELFRVKRKTEFGSAPIYAVVEREPGWLGILAPELGNGRVGWIRADTARLFRTPWAIQADLSDRELTVRRNGRVVLKAPVAIGRAGSETPTGRFGVTDKLNITAAGSPYGCCVLALSGQQPKTPQGWGGGDRLAIHNTSDPSSIGQAVSLGCLRADATTMKRLLAEVPLGTIVRIRA
jgi:hypothetical protein